MRDVVDIGEARTFMREAFRRIGRHEIDVVDRMLAVAIDEIDRAAHARARTARRGCPVRH